MKGDLPRFDGARLRTNVARIRERIEAARQRGPHAAAEVAVIAVTKSVPPQILSLCPDVGLTDVGENRVQQAVTRRPLGPPELVWHGIGHLQRNKARDAVAVFDVFHALDSIRLARRLEAVLAPLGRRWPAYIEVNASREPQKGGFQPEEALAALREILTFAHIDPIGWMTMAKAGAEEGDLRQTLRTLRLVRDEATRAGLGDPPPPGLSMGMSNDFEIAVEEGATCVRIGRALFEGVLMERPSEQGGGPA